MISSHPQKNQIGRHCLGPLLKPLIPQSRQHKKYRQCQSPCRSKRKKKHPKTIKKDRTEKYAQYFKGNHILPIPELVEAVEPKTLSLIVSDIKTRRLAGLKKEKIEETLKAAGITARYFCRRSFASWDILLPSQELATKLASNSFINTQQYRLQPEYMGRRKDQGHREQRAYTTKWRCFSGVP